RNPTKCLEDQRIAVDDGGVGLLAPEPLRYERIERRAGRECRGPEETDHAPAAADGQVLADGGEERAAERGLVERVGDESRHALDLEVTKRPPGRPGVPADEERERVGLVGPALELHVHEAPPGARRA